MSDVLGSSTSGSRQKLDALAKRDSNADTVNAISETGTMINAAQVGAAGGTALAGGTLSCFLGRVIAPLGGAMAGAWLASAVGADRPVTWLMNEVGLPTVAKPGKAPAHVKHKIVHENAFWGALAGLAAGIAVGVAIAAAAAAIVATGGAAAAVIAAAGPYAVGFVAGVVGGFVGGAVASGVSKTGSVTGEIADGSPNVSFEGKAVARVTDPVSCSKDPGEPPPQIAQGSKTISVNGLPLARIGHKITCSATIQEGCNTISADETTGTYGKINANVSILEQLVLTTADVLLMRSATKEGGLLDGVLRELLGEPIDMATGDYADYRTDFTWPHVLPLTLRRVYAGRQPVTGLLGERWICNWSQRLEYRQTEDGPATITFFDADGQQLVYPVPQDEFNAFNLWAPHYALRGSRQQPEIFDERSQQSLIFEFAGIQSSIARLSRIEDRNGNAIAFSYNALGHLCQVRHSAGFELWVNCNANGLLQSVSSHSGGKDVLVSYHFDHGRLSDVHSRFYGEFHFRYTAEGWLDHWRDSGATSVRLSYDHRGRVIATRTNTALYDDRFEYDDDERRATYVDALGHRHERWFDAENRLIRLRDPLGRVTSIAYDEYGWVRCRRDPLGRDSLYEHDARGRLAQFTNPYGQVQRYRWNDDGLLLEQRADSGTVQWHYNAEGNAVARCSPDGETRWRYNLQGQVTHRTDPDGVTRSWAYDGYGRLATSTDPLGRQTQFSHDVFGRPASRTDAAGHRTCYAYQPGPDNPREALSHIEYPDRSVRQWRYDHEGLLSESIDPLGNITRYTWGAFDLLASVTDATQAITQYHRDGAARLLGVTNAAGQQWRLERDAAGQLAAETDWSGRITRYERNVLGQITARHLPDGGTLHYDYDELDRLVAISGASRRHTFEWNSRDRLVGAQVWLRAASGEWQSDNDVRFDYDEAHRLVAESQHDQRLEYGYDAQGRPQSLATPGGMTRWQFDSAGQLETLASNGHRFDFAYDGLGQETQRRYRPHKIQDDVQPELAALYPEGYVQFQDYDEMRRLASQAVCGQSWDQALQPESVGQRNLRTYGWDAAGRCTQMRETRSGVAQEINQWRYDARDQIVSATHWSGTSAGGQAHDEQYQYDALGHIAQQEHDGVIESHRYQGDQLISAGPGIYSYDACGRVTSRTEHRRGFRPQQWLYRWDEFGRMCEALTPYGERWRYRYDAFGRRISKACVEGGRRRRARRVDYLWQGSRMIEARRDYGAPAADEAQARPARPRYELQRWHYRPGTHAVLAQERLRYDSAPDRPCSDWHPVACDPNGAPHTLYGSDGRAVWRARRRLWGETERDTTADQQRETLDHVVPDRWLAQQLWGGDDTPDCELRFAGQWDDEETGLHYNLQRYYDPKTGQYLSPDPIGLAGGLRTHAYVHDPVQWCDPLGLAACFDAKANRWRDSDTGRFVKTADGIDAHLAQFRDGASYITPTKALDTYGRDPIGRPDGQFVMPSSYLDDLMLSTRGDVAKLEDALGIPSGSWQGNPLSRIDIQDPSSVGLRMATGSESGANSLWLPGGYTSGGVPEAVVNQIPAGSYTESPIGK
ncbi:RHS repeat-associated core domain-containing protein [Paraburkholderia diazotrophica]|uniref:RHS repeat-associated core domain-containing protein n=1 Tax=Paraburkholderia diazotrophica TaxID=667676 RepID=UPI003170ED16